MNHKAIYTLYPQVVRIDDSKGIFDKDGNQVQIDMNLVNAWVDPNQYKYKREREYPLITEQLDMLWHAMNNGEIPKANSFFEAIEEIKQKYPKS